MSAAEALRKARDLLQSGAMADAWTASHGDVQTPLPVEHPRGHLRSWFVPLTCGDQLLGFFELSPELVPMRYSTFQRRPGELSQCPQATSWIDSSAVKAKARTVLRPGESMDEPFLSYDSVPSRLAWAVPIVGPRGAERLVFVAGNAVFEGSSGQRSTGGSG